MTNKLTHHLLLVSGSCENSYKELMENYIKNDERLSEKNKEYSNKFLEEFITKSQEHLYIDGIISCPYTEKDVIKDILILVPKNELINTI